MKQLITIILLGFALSACAAGARTGAMVADVSTETIIGEENPLYKGVELDAVEGGKNTNPLWTSEVGNEEFGEALRQSLALHAMLAEAGSESKYVLMADLLKVKQPVFGFNFTVKSDVHYRLIERESGKVIFDRPIHAEYTAGVGDALLGVKRLQIANEGSIQKNISTFIQMIIDEIRSNPDLEGAEGDMISQISVPVLTAALTAR
jgi:hypothetical protein